MNKRIKLANVTVSRHEVPVYMGARVKVVSNEDETQARWRPRIMIHMSWPHGDSVNTHTPGRLFDDMSFQL